MNLSDKFLEYITTNELRFVKNDKIENELKEKFQFVYISINQGKLEEVLKGEDNYNIYENYAPNYYTYDGSKTDYGNVSNLVMTMIPSINLLKIK